MTTVKGFEQRPDGIWEVRTVRTGSWLRRDRRTYTAKHRHPGRGHVGHPASAVQDARPGHAAPALRPAGRADPDQLRVDRRRREARGRPEPRPDARGGDHVVDPPDVGHPHRTRPLWQGLQRDGAAADADDRRGRPRGRRRAALEAAVGPGSRRSPPHDAVAQHPPVERTHADRPGHAAPGQFDHHLHQARQAGHPLVHQQAGTRRAEPELDSGRQPGHPPHRRKDRRRGRRNLGRTVQYAADRAFPRRRGDRRRRRARRHRPLPSRLGLSQPVCRRRRGDLGEPGRQPLAIHHRAGRAGRLAVAEQGRERRAAAAGRRAIAGWSRSRPTRPSSRPRRPARCAGCRAIT